MAEIDTTGALGRGLQLGASLGAGIRQRKLNSEYGAAINDPTQGYAGAAKIANAQGEVDDGAQFQDQGQAVAKQRLQVLGNLATSLSTVPYEQRKARIQQWAPMVQSQLGFSPEQIASVDPTDEWIANERAMVGQFSKFAKIEQMKDGALVGYDAAGNVTTLKAPPAEPMQVDTGGAVQLIDKNSPDHTLRTFDKTPVPKAPGAASGLTFDEDGNVIQGSGSLEVSRYNRAVNAATTILQHNPTFENIVGASAMLDRIEAASRNPNSIGDQELLDAFTQLNTGGGRVTEAQVHLITGSGSFGDAFNRWHAKLQSGGSLSQQQRGEILALSQEVYKNYQRSYRPLYDAAAARLKAQGIPPQFWNIPSPDELSGAVTAGDGGIDRATTMQPGAAVDQAPAHGGALPTGGTPSGGPAVGTIEDGYRFKGGNAADPHAWEPVATDSVARAISGH